MPERQRRRFRVVGTVQGVGFRPFVYRHAVDLGLAGRVANDSRGVVVEAEGAPDLLDELESRIRHRPPPLASITGFEVEPMDSTGEAGFSIVESQALGAPAAAVSVDVATCDDCRSELLDPADRRFGYPFVNCTNCGPRYTIIVSIPYDRSATTMAGFAMCDRCRREYTDPGDRRFHAEPNACPACGPKLTLLSPAGAVLAEEGVALDRAAAHLVGGSVLAVKGLGGYHLAADATSSAAVAELRRRKARDDKPFAVMVADLASARSLCRLSAEAEAALVSPRRPIVLAPRLPDAVVDPAVAPGLPELGLMLPYTPLHHLLLAAVGRPLVMTSGNLSDEPIAHHDADALARLGPLVDAVLSHDRPIHIRCDDSVVRDRGLGRPVQMVRRSRGFAPEPIPLIGRARRHVLAVGAELKNTVAVAKGTQLTVSHHIGDLEHLPAYRSFLQAVDHLCHLAGVAPELVAHDLHPEYLSTKYATDLDLPLLGVQHHHAHIASCLVEHGHAGPVLGVAFDGLGMGTDHTIWGGELLVADLDGFRRVGHLRPVPLPGGNQAIREPWRMALSWVRTALGPDAAASYGNGADKRWAAVLDLVERPDALVTSSAGRLFDAVAALVGVRDRVTYEGQAAIELEARAFDEPLEGPGGYGVGMSRSDNGTLVVDPAPLIGKVLAEQALGTPVGRISAGFHAGLGLGVAAAAAELAAAEGLETVALSGGVFQNSRLTAIVETARVARGLLVLVHRHVPPNDGGVSVGQAAVAARR
ncbi:MAG: carbamoyltransferase HypF [Acidimicrobiales bacterium]